MRAIPLMPIACLALAIIGCAPTRYENYTLAGSNKPWLITADKSFGGTVTIKIDGTEAVEGRVPVYSFTGPNEYEGEYQGHNVKLVLTKEATTAPGDMGYRCIVMIDGPTIAARFSW